MFQSESDLKVVALICVYEPSDFLYEQVESIIQCGIRDIVISDDSTVTNKTTLNILQKYAESSDVRITYQEGPKLGLASANFLYSITSLNDVDWLFLSDQDDIWEKDKVYQYQKTMFQVDSSTPAAICSDACLIDELGNVINKSLQYYQKRFSSILNNDDILIENCVQGATLCINKSLIKHLTHCVKLEGLELLSKSVMFDWLIASIAKYGGTCFYIDKPLLRYRQHHSNIIGAMSITSRIFHKPIARLMNINRRYCYLKSIVQKCLGKNMSNLAISPSNRLKLYTSKLFVLFSADN